MITTLLLIIIYFAFISLGLPDSLLGATWPVMQNDLNAPLPAAGILSMAVAGSTIISSFLSGKVLKLFGTGRVTIVSVFMTACALLGFSIAPSLVWLIVFSIPLGLGAGAVDAGLNDYVATHYKAHHMSWLHCFWGIGATLGPIIMAQFMIADHTWRRGYLVIAGIQFSLVIILFFSLPLWKKVSKSNSHFHQETKNLDENVKDIKPLQIKGVKLALVSFLFYCGVEASMGLWGSSYLVNIKGLDAAKAAEWVSYYFAGITFGRFVTGFITFKMTNRALIRTGQFLALFGSILLVLPFPTIFSLLGFVIVGVGLAPIFPCMLHETPTHFGKKHSQRIMGYQMGIAYTGTTFLPPLLGFLASQTTIGIFPFCIVIFVMVMFLSTERLNLVLNNKKFVQ